MPERSLGDFQPLAEKPYVNQKARGLYFFLRDLSDLLGSSTGGPRALDQSLTDQQRKDAHDESIENVRQNRQGLLADLYDDTQRAFEFKKRADQGSLTEADEFVIEGLMEKYRPIDEDLKLGRLEDSSLKGV